MTIDLKILNDYVEKGLVERNPHPTLPIAIYNYSRTTQYEGKWDEITKMCRGLVVDNEGTVVAKSFNKFFNMEEHSPEEIPNEPFEIFEKLDGSLGILFNYNGEWILATKGSFSSDQAIKGMEILKKYKYDRLLTGFTYLFEIIYPENRIVCQYDFEDLILLSIIDNNDGYELRIHDDTINIGGNRVKNILLNLGIKMVKKYNSIDDYTKLKQMIGDNSEGYVIRFKNGFRMKIKGEEYVRLHRILTGFSYVDIWEYLKDGKDINELLERVPDEFDTWVRNTVKDLRYTKMSIQEHAGKLYDSFIENLSGPPHEGELPPRKVIAEWVMLQDEHIRPILFRMFDNKDYSDYIWKLIKPKYSKPFWQKEVES